MVWKPCWSFQAGQGAQDVQCYPSFTVVTMGGLGWEDWKVCGSAKGEGCAEYRMARCAEF